MKIMVWLGAGLVVAMMVAAAFVLAPASASPLRNISSLTPATSSANDPNWNSGNLCNVALTTTTVNGHVVTNCTSAAYGTPAGPTTSAVPAYLWYNFSSGETQGTITNIIVLGSVDCITLNFHSFDSWINIAFYGSWYTCGTVGGPANSPGFGPGVNIALNSEGDNLTVTSYGSFFTSLLYVYGTTSAVQFQMYGSFLTQNVFFIGTTAGFATCPSGITAGRIVARGTSWGYGNILNSIWVDGTNVAIVPPNVPYSTMTWWPMDGGLGTNDMLGTEVTTTAPAGGCSYL